MLLTEFDYQLPSELIAQTPLAKRSGCRLLVLERAQRRITHRQFSDLPDLLTPADLVVFNRSRVIPARLYAQRTTGGRVEIFVERLWEERGLLAQIRPRKRIKVGERLWLDATSYLEVVEERDWLWRLEVPSDKSRAELLAQYGQVPLPPYIRRDSNLEDQRYYQTIYAREDGSVAAPTAGLHFDQELLSSLAQRGIRTSSVMLHVGLGTFQPVKSEKITDHKIHSEYCVVDEAVCGEVVATRAAGGRTVVVGTTSLRALESASLSGQLTPYLGETDIFIYGDYPFKSSDALITNFHLPKSTLLMLVCAFAGYELVMEAYQEAIRLGYRFYSYGDAMLIL